MTLWWRLTPLNLWHLSTVIDKHLTEVLLNVFHDFLIDIVSSCSVGTPILSKAALILIYWWLELHIALELGVSWRHIGLNIIVGGVVPATIHLVTKVHLVAV